MSLIDSIKKGQRLPFYTDKAEKEQKIEFWQNSVEMSDCYLNDGDANGLDVLIRFACESDTDYKSRKRAASLRNYCQLIVSKYVASVFRHYPNRVWSDTLIDVANNFDLEGTNVNTFMQDSLETAIVEGEAWVLIDSTSDETSYVSELQKKLNGDRLFVRKLDSESIVNYSEIDEKLLEVVITFERIDGIYARWYDKENFVEFALNKNGVVESISEATPHGFSQLPVVRLKPMKGEESFISPIANSQKTLINLLSLVQQELQDQTFSKFLLSNFTPEQDENGNTKIVYGTKRMMTTSQDAKVQSLAADVTQAQSIRDQIKDELESLYRIAGLSSSQYSMDSANISGVSRLIAQESFFINCSRFKAAIEAFENTIVALIAEIEGIEFVPTIMSDSYNEPDLQEATQTMRDLLSLDVPKIIKDKMVLAFTNKFFNFTKEDNDILLQQLNAPQSPNQV